VTPRGFATVLAAALAAAPLVAAARQGSRDPVSEPVAAPVPAVPQASAATLAPAVAPAPARPSTEKLAPAPVSIAPAKPAVAPRAPSAPPPARAWRRGGRASSGVAPGVLARAAARTQQARAPAVPPGCELPPERREAGTECPPVADNIESVEIDWSAPATR
jgi:hypothetical protein